MKKYLSYFFFQFNNKFQTFSISNHMFSSNLDQESSKADSYSRIYTIINSTGMLRLKLSEKLTNFSNNLQSLLLSETIHYGSTIHDIIILLTSIITINTRIANSEIRCSDDLRDVVERFTVVKRLANDQFESMRTVDSLTKKLIEAEKKNIIASKQPNYNEIRFKCMKPVDMARMERKYALERAKRLTQELIIAQEKYNEFKIKRQIHAWTFYAQNMKPDYVKLAQLFDQLSETLSQLHE